MANRRQRTLIELVKKSKDAGSFFKELQEESDRSTAILGAAILDEMLRQLIFAFLVDDEGEVKEFLDTEKPLGAFGARIRTAYCIGLIPLALFKDLIIVKNVRNIFAHQLHGLSFSEESIAKECAKLQSTRLILPGFGFEEMPRNRFISVVIFIYMHLEQKIIWAEKNRCKSPLA